MTDATWKKKPNSADYDDGNNWTGNVVPDGTATFGASSKLALSLSGNNTVGAWVFTAEAGHYRFAQPVGYELDFTGKGISSNGGSATIDVSGHVVFTNSAVAGKAHFIIENESALDFGGTSKASASIIQIKPEGQASIFGSSTAANAHITIAETGLLQFEDSGAGGKATIETAGTITLNELASMGAATLTIDPGASSSVVFYDLSTAGSAKIADHGFLEFTDNSTAASAVITVANEAKLEFFANSTGGEARIINKAGGTVDFSGTDGPVNGITVGSIEGAGEFIIGANELTVGSNNRSTKVSGLITDNGAGGGIDMVGTGTLTLSHQDNSFSKGIRIDSGTLSIAAKGAAGTAGITFGNGGGEHLKIANAALSGHDFSTVISGFDFNDTIDLTGLKFVHGAKATFDSGTLTVKSGGVADTLHLFLLSAPEFKASNDGHGGTKVVISGELEKPVHDVAHISAHDAGHDFLL